MASTKPPSSTSPQVASGPGETLRAAREARGASAQDVADVLNLTTAVVEDLEAEAWERLPGAAFTRGYLRAYAKLVDLDAAPLLDAYGEGIAAPEAQSPGRSLGGAEPARFTEVVHKQPGAILTGSVAAVIVVVVFVIWLVWPAETPQKSDIVGRQPPAPNLTAPGGPKPPLPVDEAPVAAPEAAVVAEPADEVVEPASDAAETASGVVAAGDDAREDPVVSNVVAAPVGSAPAEPADPVEVEPVADIAVAQGGDDRLSLVFREDCWVEVRDAAGRNIHSDLSRSGDVLQLSGQAPFSIRLGYAPGVELRFNDEPVALAPHTRNNVASLVLGQ